MQNRGAGRNRLVWTPSLLGIALLIATLAGCGRSQQEQSEARRYPLKGRVVSIDKTRKQVTVEHGDIPGFMGAMTMPYPVKDAASLDSLAPGDQITADVVADGSKVWLEDIVVTKESNQTETPPATSHSSPPGRNN